MLQQLMSFSLYSWYSPQQTPFPMPPSKARLIAVHAYAGQQQQWQLNESPEVPYWITLESSSESEWGSLRKLWQREQHSDRQWDWWNWRTCRSCAHAKPQKHEMECEETVIQLFHMITQSMDDWKRAESHIQGHYAGNSECTQRQEKCWLEAKAKGDEEMCRRHTLKYCIILTGSVRLITFQWHLQQCSKVIFLRKRIPKIKIPRSLQHQTYCLTSQMTSLNAHKPLHSPNPSASWSSPCTCMYTVLHPSCHGSHQWCHCGTCSQPHPCPWLLKTDHLGPVWCMIMNTVCWPKKKPYLNCTPWHIWTVQCMLCHGVGAEIPWGILSKMEDTFLGMLHLCPRPVVFRYL